jgi:hypothetical protein
MTTKTEKEKRTKIIQVIWSSEWEFYCRKKRTKAKQNYLLDSKAHTIEIVATIADFNAN